MDTVFYVGTDDGVSTVRSTDRRSWEVQNKGLEGWAIPKLTVDPSAPNRIFTGTRGDGVWVSEDFGASWKKPSYGKRGPGKVRALTFDARNNRLYAGCEPIDIFVSEDLGASWERLDSVWDVPWVPTVTYPAPTVEPHVRDIVIDTDDPNTIYAALQVGYIIKSTDGGKTWKLIDRDYDCDVHTMVLDPTNPKRMLIATGGHDNRQGKTKGRALYMTPDAGETWEPLAMNFTQEYSVPLTMHPRDPNVLYSAVAHGQPGAWRARPETGSESLIIRSNDGGHEWQKLETGISGASKQFPEAIVIDPDEPAVVYAACRNGDLYASEDGGDSWTSADAPLRNVADLKLVHA
jgi:photosystem II stability/assembly factor-like uncharacterized protein